MLRVWKVLIAFGVVYAAVAASTGALLVVDRNAELVAGERRASLLADIAAEHVRQVVFAIDLGFAALDDDVRAAVRQGAHFDEALADRFRVVTRLAPALLGIGYVDIEGAFRVGASGTATAGIDLSDRDYFQELRDARPMRRYGSGCRSFRGQTARCRSRSRGACPHPTARSWA